MLGSILRSPTRPRWRATAPASPALRRNRGQGLASRHPGARPLAHALQARRSRLERSSLRPSLRLAVIVCTQGWAFYALGHALARKIGPAESACLVGCTSRWPPSHRLPALSFPSGPAGLAAQHLRPLAALGGFCALGGGGSRWRCGVPGAPHLPGRAGHGGLQSGRSSSPIFLALIPFFGDLPGAWQIGGAGLVVAATVAPHRRAVKGLCILHPWA